MPSREGRTERSKSVAAAPVIVITGKALGAAGPERHTALDRTIRRATVVALGSGDVAVARGVGIISPSSDSETPMTNMIGPALRQVRTRARLSQRTLADSIDTTQSHVSAMEANQGTPSVPTLARFAAAANHTLGLFFIENTQHQPEAPPVPLSYRCPQATVLPPLVNPCREAAPSPFALQWVAGLTK